MVQANRNRILFGNGDVSVLMSMAGTIDEPQAVIVFQNREPTKIGIVEENADMSRTKTGCYYPDKDIMLMFSKPESIDCVISALKAVKRAAFGPNSVADAYLGEGDPFEE